MTFDKGRLIDNITHLVPGRDDLLGALDRGDYDATLIDLAPLRRPPRRAPRHGDHRLRLLLSDRRQSRLCRARQRSCADRGRQQGADRSCGRGQNSRIRQAGRPDLSAAARAGDPRGRLDEDHSAVRWLRCRRVPLSCPATLLCTGGSSTPRLSRSIVAVSGLDRPVKPGDDSEVWEMSIDAPRSELAPYMPNASSAPLVPCERPTTRHPRPCAMFSPGKSRPASCCAR